MFTDKRPFRRRWRWALAIAASCLSVATALALWTQRTRDPRHHRVELAFVTELMGITAPCGCTSRPLGGLDIMAALLEQRRQQGPFAWLSAGSTFFDRSPGSVELAGHRRATSHTVAELFARLAPTMSVLSREDAAESQASPAPPWQGTSLRVARPSASLPWQSTLTLGEHPIGLLGVAGAPSADDVAALSSAASNMRKHGHDGVVLLFAGNTPEARRTLSGLAHVDVIVAGHDGPPSDPEPLGDGMLVDAGARGEYVGVLTLSVVHAQTPRRWQWDDGGKALRRPLQLLQERFVSEAQALPAGPGKDARLARAAAIGEQIAALAAPVIDSVRVQWELVPLDADLPRATWAQRALGRYNDSLCATAVADSGQRPCTPARDEASQYVGSASCQACHLEPWQVWQASRHAHAWATLADAHKACDLSCVGCHVVGWEKPGGFCHLADNEPFQNVGCESCHGPGSGHVAHPTERQRWSQQFVRNTPEATCRSCHNAQHSDQFADATYRPRILGPGHGAPLTEPAKEAPRAR